jgi:hypothetical protein
LHQWPNDGPDFFGGRTSLVIDIYGMSSENSSSTLLKMSFEKGSDGQARTDSARVKKTGVIRSIPTGEAWDQVWDSMNTRMIAHQTIYRRVSSDVLSLYIRLPNVLPPPQRIDEAKHTHT